VSAAAQEKRNWGMTKTTPVLTWHQWFQVDKGDAQLSAVEDLLRGNRPRAEVEPALLVSRVRRRHRRHRGALLMLMPPLPLLMPQEAGRRADGGSHASEQRRAQRAEHADVAGGRAMDVFRETRCRPGCCAAHRAAGWLVAA
jgi:hypothetical protein